MTGHSVEKIGGTSMAATATLFDNVLIAGRTGAALEEVEAAAARLSGGSEASDST